MNLTIVLEGLQQDLQRLSELGDERSVQVAQRLSDALASNLRLKLFDLLSQVAVELSSKLPSGHIEVRLAGQEPELVAHDEESQRLVDNARVELSPHGHRPTVLVDVPQKKGFSISIFGRSGIECRIRCPHDSGLSVRTKSADISTRGTIGGLNVQTASGDLDVNRVSGGVNVKSASSDFSA